MRTIILISVLLSSNFTIAQEFSRRDISRQVVIKGDEIIMQTKRNNETLEVETSCEFTELHDAKWVQVSASSNIRVGNFLSIRSSEGFEKCEIENVDVT